MSFVFLFKQKTAYELRISDWSSDVCASDLRCSASEFLPQLFDRLVVALQADFGGDGARELRRIFLTRELVELRPGRFHHRRGGAEVTLFHLVHLPHEPALLPGHGPGADGLGWLGEHHCNRTQNPPALSG